MKFDSGERPNKELEKSWFERHFSVTILIAFFVYFAIVLAVTIIKGSTAGWVVGIVIPVGIVCFGLGWEKGQENLLQKQRDEIMKKMEEKQKQELLNKEYEEYHKRKYGEE